MKYTHTCKDCGEKFISQKKANEYKKIVCMACKEKEEHKKKVDKFGIVTADSILGFIFCTPDSVSPSDTSYGTAKFAGVYKKKHVNHSI